MTPLSPEARLKDLLDETRLTMLGTQVLMGLQYQAAFQPGFARLSDSYRWLDGAAQILILTAAALLMMTPCLHQIAEEGHVSGRILSVASTSLKIALLPIALALGLDIAIATISELGTGLSLGAGALFALGAVIAWYAFPAWVAEDRQEDDMLDKQQSLETRIVQALTELRVILPGAQALFGFQFTAVLTESFGKLPMTSKMIHLLGGGFVAIAIVMLIAPAAYHRIAAGGNAEDRVLRYTVRMMLPAIGLIALGLVSDTYVTIRIISDMPRLALTISLVALAGFAGLIYGVPLAARRLKPTGASFS